MYIKRKDAMEVIYKLDFCLTNLEYFAHNDLMRAIPAADVVEVRHAKWDDNHKCTACGNEALLEEKPDTMAHGLNSLFFVDSDYCPNCGAKMDKGGQPWQNLF